MPKPRVEISEWMDNFIRERHNGCCCKCDTVGDIRDAKGYAKNPLIVQIKDTRKDATSDNLHLVCWKCGEEHKYQFYVRVLVPWYFKIISG